MSLANSPMVILLPRLPGLGVNSSSSWTYFLNHFHNSLGLQQYLRYRNPICKGKNKHLSKLVGHSHSQFCIGQAHTDVPNVEQLNIVTYCTNIGRISMIQHLSDDCRLRSQLPETKEETKGSGWSPSVPGKPRLYVIYSAHEINYIPNFHLWTQENKARMSALFENLVN